MRFNLTLSQKAIIILTAALALQTSFVISLARMQRNNVGQIEEGDINQSIITRVNASSSLWSTLAANHLRVIFHLEGHGKGSLPKTRALCEAKLQEVLPLLDNPDDQNEIAALASSTDLAFDRLNRMKEAHLSHQERPVLEYLTEVGVEADQVTQRSNNFIDRLLARQQKDQADQLIAQTWMKVALVAGLSLNFILLVAIAYFFAREIADKLALIDDNSWRLASGAVLNPVLSGTDEIARLDQEFHKMSDALVAANIKERAVADNVLDLICSLDARAVFLTANPAAESILGYRPDGLLGRSYMDLVAKEDRERTGAAFKSLMAGETIDSFEHAAIRKNGSHADLRLSAHWSKADKSLFCVISDITERRQLERLKRDFMAVITRDLRGPLLSTLSTLKSLPTEAEDEEAAIASVQNARLEIKPMLTLISDLLEIEKFDAAMLSLKVGKINVSDIIMESIESVREEAAQKNIAFNLRLTEIVLEADKARLNQAFTRLLGNAVRVSPPDSSIGIMCHQNSFAVIEISDCGSQLSNDEQESIFDPLGAVRGTTSEEGFERPDLGFAICKSIIEAHRGTIRIASDGPVGNTFSINIPLHYERN